MSRQEAKEKARELFGLAPVAFVIGPAIPAVYSLAVAGHPLAIVAVPLMILSAYAVGMWDMHTGQRGAKLARRTGEAATEVKAAFTRGGGAHE